MSTRHGLGAVLLVAVLLVSSCVRGAPDIFIIKVASSAPADEPGSRALPAGALRSASGIELPSLCFGLSSGACKST